jgi:hypothetical protein
MSWVKTTTRFIHAWRHPDETSHEVETELRFHVEMRTRANLAEGMTPDVARLAARQSFGDFHRFKAECCQISRSLPFGLSLRVGIHVGTACLAGGAALWAVNMKHDNLIGVLCQLAAIAVLLCSFLIGRRSLNRAVRGRRPERAFHSRE